MHLQKETDELIHHIFRLECLLFTKMNSYQVIEQKKDKKCFQSDERQQLYKEIQNSFSKLIQTIENSCPSLTNEDIAFCCLAKLGLDNSIICRCMGTVNKQAANQRKYRIKKKMKEACCETLFDLIFIYK